MVALDSDEQLLTKITECLDGLWNISESDSPVFAVSVSDDETGEISLETVASLFQPSWDEHSQSLAGGTRVCDEDSTPLDQQQSESFDAVEFFAQRSFVHDDSMRENYDKWGKLGQVIQSNLDKLVGYRFGSTEVTYCIAGRSPTGRILGVFTGSVET